MKSKKIKKDKKSRGYSALIEQIRSNKLAAIVYFTLRLLVIVTIVRCAI